MRLVNRRFPAVAYFPNPLGAKLLCWLGDLEFCRALALGQGQQIVFVMAGDLDLGEFTGRQITFDIDTTVDVLRVGLTARHPWLLDEFLEEIAGLQLNDPDCKRLRDETLAVHQAEEHLDNKNLLEHLSRAGYGAELERLQRATAQGAGPHFAHEASKEQVLEGWHHIMMLHSKAGVPRSLQEAENDYLSEPTIENFSKLQAIVQQHEFAAS